MKTPPHLGLLRNVYTFSFFTNGKYDACYLYAVIREKLLVILDHGFYHGLYDKGVQLYIICVYYLCFVWLLCHYFFCRFSDIYMKLAFGLLNVWVVNIIDDA
jgi:hypothetical protein